MTRRNDKRNERRNRNHNKPSREQAAHMAASMMMGAVMAKAFNDIFDGKDNPLNKVHEQFERIKHTDGDTSGKVIITDSEIQQLKEGTANLTKIKVPDDGSAIEFPLPDYLQMFFNEEGKPMIHRKIEGDGEPTNEVPKPITYEDIAKDLYKGQRAIYWNPNVAGEEESIEYYDCDWGYANLYNCTTRAQVKRLKAFNKLQNIAQYLNDGWHPNFNDESDKYFIYKDVDDTFNVGCNIHCMSSGVHFKTKALAEEAARIMGEDSLADLFNTNW